MKNYLYNNINQKVGDLDLYLGCTKFVYNDIDYFISNFTD